MRVAVVSDIHGNRHAFEAVLDGRRPQRRRRALVPRRPRRLRRRPRRLRAARARARCGLPGRQPRPGGDGRPPARRVLARRRAGGRAGPGSVIAAEHLEYLRRAAPRRRRPTAVGLYHASPRDPIWEYVLSSLLAELCLDAQRERVCLVGHSHVASGLRPRPTASRRTGSPRRRRRVRSTCPPASGWSTPAASGQPRDGDAARRVAAARHRARRPPSFRRDGLRHRRRRGRDPRRPAARLARRAPASTVSRIARA